MPARPLTAQAVAAECGPANGATHEAIRRLASRREPLPEEWRRALAVVLDDPAGELADVLRAA